jgi:D-serine deaminase-like pyridoxal phosphate-dependent protein
LTAKKHQLATPAVLVSESALARNIKKAQTLCTHHTKRLWPMVKTHKCTAVALMQQKAGADGFLCGALDECEALADIGIANIMYAYPVATQPSIDRVIALSKRCNFFVRIDGTENAKLLNGYAEGANARVNYTIIIDSGLRRFGVAPAGARELADAIRPYKGLCFKGISTHPGHVYAARPDEVPAYVEEEKRAMSAALSVLRGGGYAPEMIGSGSTPTFAGAVDDGNINVYHPGNYIFNDVMQLSLGVSGEEDCALTVLASVIAQPAADRFIIDAGSKTLGMDTGAHNNAAVSGYGLIKGHPELAITGLSEEVGKVAVSSATSLRVGDKIEIIPNHACVVTNLANRLALCSGTSVTGYLKVDMKRK